MDFTVTISVVGLALTAWGIVLAIKNTKYPGEITFIREQTISLFEDIVRNIPDLKVLYKDNPIPTNIVLIKGALINTGKKDISPSMVERPINISAQEKFKWISIQSVSASEDVHGNLSILDSKSLVINMGLFRCNEYIRFQALLQVPLDEIMKDNKGFRKISIEDQIWKYIAFDHRIEGTRSIKRVDFEDISPNNKSTLPLVFLLALIFIMLSLFWLIGEHNMLAYKYSPNQVDSLIVRVESIKDTSIVIRGIGKEFKETLTLNSFISKCSKVPVVIKDYRIREEIIGIGISLVFIPFIDFMLSFKRRRFNRKIVKLLQQREIKNLDNK